MISERNRNKFIKIDMFFQRERNTGLSFSNFFGQSEKISAKENCLYGIIDTRITSFLDCGFWFLGNSIMSYPVRSYLSLNNKKCCIYAVLQRSK